MPNADGRRELPRRRNSGSPTSENSENANFVELRKAEVQPWIIPTALSVVRIGPGSTDRGGPKELRASPLFSCPYSPTFGEGRFYEVRL
jgi:hypothetical protein